ncbi:MAG: hypothetical protein JWO95_891 [Verrucomicrobiales bacterium]|nr:hypothetical protein [Verrucomicrobiales bacterium]
MTKTVFCIATSEYKAESILEELHVAGLSDDQISLLLADKTRAVVRGVTGAVTTDSAVGWLPQVESIVISGVGAFIGNGLLATAVGQAASGSHKGAIARGLTGLGLASEQAENLEERLRNGEVLLTVNADEEKSKTVRALLEHNEAEQIIVTGERPRVEAAPRLREEKLEQW